MFSLAGGAAWRRVGGFETKSELIMWIFVYKSLKIKLFYLDIYAVFTIGMLDFFAELIEWG